MKVFYAKRSLDVLWAPALAGAFLLAGGAACKRERSTDPAPPAERIERAAEELKEAAGKMVDETQKTLADGVEDLEEHTAPTLEEVRKDLAEFGESIRRSTKDSRRSLEKTGREKLDRLGKWLDAQTRSVEDHKEDVVGQLRGMAYDLEAKLDVLNRAQGRKRKKAEAEVRATLKALQKRLDGLKADDLPAGEGEKEGAARPPGKVGK